MIFKLLTEGEETSHGIMEYVEYAALAIEILAVVIIVAAVFYATAAWIVGGLRPETRKGTFGHYRVRLGKALILGLEILVAADIIRTVVFDPSLESITVLGILVLTRTFLSWSLAVELEGRWPWKGKSEDMVELEEAEDAVPEAG